jgi:hypothetical protein
MATNTTTQGLQDEFFKVIRAGQETVIEGIRTCVETIQSVSPKVPQVHLPLADKLPKPADVVASAYDFAEKLLASQRQFAEEMLSVTAPVADSTQSADGGQQKSPTTAKK